MNSCDCSFCKKVLKDKVCWVIWCDMCHGCSATYEAECIRKSLDRRCGGDQGCGGNKFLVPFEYLKSYGTIYDCYYRK